MLKGKYVYLEMKPHLSLIPHFNISFSDTKLFLDLPHTYTMFFSHLQAFVQAMPSMKNTFNLSVLVLLFII